MKVRFHLPGIAQNFRFNMVFMAMLENCPEYFREGIEIASFYGAFPQSIWNGGRAQDGLCDKNFIKTVLNTINGKGIPVRFTFTNPALEEKHLSDSFCNMVLNMANNGLNEVIVVSSILEGYIRKYFPEYKLTSSTCKRLDDIDSLNEELERDYHIVVVDYDLNNKYELLEKIQHKEKCEFLVNSNCMPACPRRKNHYYTLGQQQIACVEHMHRFPNAPFDNTKFGDGFTQTCPHARRDIFEIKELSTNIKPDDIWEKYVPMGFEQFKIEGRTTNLFNLMETYIYYMIKPECSEYARYILLNNLAANNILTIN